jgi:hypothetical protein
VSRRRALVTQADIDRAIRAAKKAGLPSFEIIIEGPRVIVRVPGLSTELTDTVASDEPAVDSWDTVVAKLERRQ